MRSVILADLFNIPLYSTGIIFSIFFNTFWGNTHQCYHFFLYHTRSSLSYVHLSFLLACFPSTPFLPSHQPHFLAIFLTSATLLYHSKCALMKLHFSTKDLITCLDRCKQDWDQELTFGNPECIQLQKDSWHYWIAQHHPNVLRFVDEEIAFCST